MALWKADALLGPLYGEEVRKRDLGEDGFDVFGREIDFGGYGGSDEVVIHELQCFVSLGASFLSRLESRDLSSGSLTRRAASSGETHSSRRWPIS
jgi:hypothetical protein